AAPSTCRSSVSSRSSLPASRSCMIAAAVNVFVIEPMRYCVSGVASRPASTSAAPTAVSQMSSPSRRTAALMLGARFSRCACRTSRSRRAASRSGISDMHGERLLHPLDRLLDGLVPDIEVRDGAQPARAEAANADVALEEARAQAGLVGDGDEVRLHGRGVDPDPFREPPRASVVLRESINIVVERVEHRRRGDSRLPERAAEEELALPGALDGLRGSG